MGAVDSPLPLVLSLNISTVALLKPPGPVLPSAPENCTGEVHSVLRIVSVVPSPFAVAATTHIFSPVLGVCGVLNHPVLPTCSPDSPFAAGAPVIVDTLQCAMCPSSVLPANAMIYFSSANPVDMGKALDIFASEEMQRWMFSNMAPHANFTDQGIVVFND